MRCFEVGRADLSVTRVTEAELDPPRPGEVLFEVERFGFSANNVTYALLGDTLRYWDLFPAEPGWGRIPVWGYLRVLASTVPGLDAGRRAFGLCPMATHVLLRPDRTGQATFAEGSPHRADLSSVYNVYAWAPPGPPADDDALIVLRPLFWLSFTLDDHLAQRAHPDQPVIVTSASSKAALGLAHLLARRGVPVTGLTSGRRVAFLAGLSAYDQVLGYDQIGALPVGPATLVDIAGDAALREQVARRLDGHAEVVLAGGTHGEAAPLAAGAFSAPQYIRARARERGWPELERRYQAALEGFAASATWLDLRRHHGLDEAARVYRDVLTNASPPATAHIINLTSSALCASRRDPGGARSGLMSPRPR
jgi:NADPH:quinone reductase-like Zn-dependent oxidoreductase